MSVQIHCSILTPEKVVFEGDADAVYLYSHDGELGVLGNHAPMVTTLGIGMLRVIQGASTSFFEVEGGLAEVSRNRLIVLAEEAMKKEELSEKQIHAELDSLKDAVGANRFESKKIEIRKQKLSSRLNVATK